MAEILAVCPLCAFKQPNAYELANHALQFCILIAGFNVEVQKSNPLKGHFLSNKVPCPRTQAEGTWPENRTPGVGPQYPTDRTPSYNGRYSGQRICPIRGGPAPLSPTALESESNCPKLTFTSCQVPRYKTCTRTLTPTVGPSDLRVSKRPPPNSIQISLYHLHAQLFLAGNTLRSGSKESLG